MKIFIKQIIFLLLLMTSQWCAYDVWAQRAVIGNKRMAEIERDAKFQGAKTQSDSLTEALHRYDIHLGLGIANGFRLGARWLFDEDWSAELGFGTSFFLPFAFFVKSPINISLPAHYSIGINWHPYSQKSSLILNTTCTYVDFDGLGNPSRFIISPSIGLLSFSKSKSRFWGKLGLGTGFSQDRESGLIEFLFIPQIDIGISIQW